jgi:hypothetical protein
VVTRVQRALHTDDRRGHGSAVDLEHEARLSRWNHLDPQQGDAGVHAVELAVACLDRFADSGWRVRRQLDADESPVGLGRLDEPPELGLSARDVEQMHRRIE